jgi:hypothetical protein
MCFAVTSKPKLIAANHSTIPQYARAIGGDYAYR